MQLIATLGPPHQGVRRIHHVGLEPALAAIVGHSVADGDVLELGRNHAQGSLAAGGQPLKAPTQIPTRPAPAELDQPRPYLFRRRRQRRPALRDHLGLGDQLVPGQIVILDLAGILIVNGKSSKSSGARG